MGRASLLLCLTLAVFILLTSVAIQNRILNTDVDASKGSKGENIKGKTPYCFSIGMTHGQNNALPGQVVIDKCDNNDKSRWDYIYGHAYGCQIGLMPETATEVPDNVKDTCKSRQIDIFEKYESIVPLTDYPLPDYF